MQHVRVGEDVVSRDAGEGLIVLNLATGMYYGLEGVGARIWALLPDSDSPKDLVAKLADEFDADEATLASDVDRFLEELSGAGLVVPDEH